MNQNAPQTLLPAFMKYDQLNAGLGVVVNQFRKRQTVHAYLLTGARGLGKRTLATVLAGALFCTSQDKPCGVCPACRRLLDGNEPDLLTLFADDGKQIGVERVRELIQKINQHAFGSGYRVVLIEPMEKMTAQAQNCLLKSLEEPIANVVFLLMTHEMSATLGTIASRCVRVKLTPWPDQIMQETLLKFGYENTQIQSVLVPAAGNIGTALEMLSTDSKNIEFQAFVNQMLEISCDSDCVRLSTKLKEDKGGADGYLNAIEQAIHRSLLVKSGQLDAQAMASFPARWQKTVERCTIKDLNALLSSVFETRRRKFSQVNWQSNIDHFMIKLLEEQSKWQQS